MYSMFKFNVVVVVLILLHVQSVFAVEKFDMKASDYSKDEFSSILRQYLFKSYTEERGVHIESVLSTIGALSGFALQMGIRDEFITKRGGSEDKVFSVIKTKNGETYYFGDIFDEPLINPRKGNFSVWSIVAGGVKKSGSTDYPDINKIVKDNASVVGSESYGVHGVPKHNQPKEHPLVSLQKHWKFTQKLLIANKTEPLMWSWKIALVAQDLIGVFSNQGVPASFSSQVIMESAVSMSKIDPKKVESK